jgi:hypothetical protein
MGLLIKFSGNGCADNVPVLATVASPFARERRRVRVA